MLKKQNRLKKMKDFTILFNDGRFLHNSFISAKVWPVDPNTYPKRGYSKEDLRVGFVVGTKISKSAVKRNSIKRKMREVVRLLIKGNRLKQGYFIAFIAGNGIVGKKYAEIEDELKILLQNMGVLKE